MSVVDPSGSIPKSLIEAAAGENCKKVLKIRDMCEAMHTATPLVDWHFDPTTGAPLAPRA
jgi:hypothetical protein